MSATVRWTGLHELFEQLRALPAELAADAASIVEDAAEGAADDARFGYPERTGNLADHVIVQRQSGGPLGVSVLVRNTAHHAHLFELGTETRKNSLGANRGRMPPGRVFIPAMRRARAAMYVELKELLMRHGAKRVA